MSGDEEYDEDEGTEFRVFCDASQVTLACDGGWYHKIGEDYDLCTAEYSSVHPRVVMGFGAIVASHTSC
jgi:hypothetical protein